MNEAAKSSILDVLRLDTPESIGAADTFSKGFDSRNYFVPCAPDIDAEPNHA